jgi:hypothetical protein
VALISGMGRSAALEHTSRSMAASRRWTSQIVQRVVEAEGVVDS